MPSVNWITPEELSEVFYRSCALAGAKCQARLRRNAAEQPEALEETDMPCRNPANSSDTPRPRSPWGSGDRQITAMRIRAGRMRALLAVESYQGHAGSLYSITLEEARALGKWLTNRVRQFDWEIRRERSRRRTCAVQPILHRDFGDASAGG
jgi:hypothetical protein